MRSVGSIPSYSTVFFRPIVPHYELKHLYLSPLSGVYWKRYKAKTTTSRNKLIQTSVFTKTAILTKFTGFVKQKLSGRSISGRRACWTKGSYCISKPFVVVKNFTTLSAWCCSIALARSSRTGAWCQQMITAARIQFLMTKSSATHFFSITLIAPLKYFRRAPLITYLCWISNNTTIFSFSLTPGAECVIARAAGSCGYYLTHASFAKQFATIILPSGFLKILSKFILITREPCNFTANKFVVRRGAGFYRRHGKHPNTRGIAMNATDHPHGGKTHTVAMPVSPWGQNTKLK